MRRTQQGPIPWLPPQLYATSKALQATGVIREGGQRRDSRARKPAIQRSHRGRFTPSARARRVRKGEMTCISNRASSTVPKSYSATVPRLLPLAFWAKWLSTRSAKRRSQPCRPLRHHDGCRVLLLRNPAALPGWCFRSSLYPGLHLVPDVRRWSGSNRSCCRPSAPGDAGCSFRPAAVRHQRHHAACAVVGCQHAGKPHHSGKDRLC